MRERVFRFQTRSLIWNNFGTLNNFFVPLFFRPDLVEWKRVEKMRVRERIDLAFHVMDREYGVTRLLDPEGKNSIN